MGGLAGILRLDGAEADRDLVARMLETMRHRGPDGSPIVARGPVALAHLALETTADARSAVAADAERRVWVVFDGRLDNRDELAAGLGDQAPGRRRADAALVLDAYARWGGGMFERLVGDFALALWDEAGRQLWCARDALGIRPFYYHADARAFRWASEPQALFADPSVGRRPNEGFLAECLAAQPTSLDETVYADIHRLPAAHVLVVSPQGLRRWRYWDPHPPELRGLSDDESAERVGEALRRAVAARLRETPSVGAHLSGGLDSSAVVATALEVMREGRVEARRLDPVSLVFPRCSFDERREILAVASHLGVGADLVDPTPIQLDAVLEPIARYGELPDLPTGEPLARPLLARVREKGLRVVLTGFGGDQWFEGSTFWYADLLRSGRLRVLWGRLRIDGEGTVGQSASLFAQAGLLPLVPVGFRRRLRRWLGVRRSPAWIRPEFARRTSLEDRLTPAPLEPLEGSFARADLKRLLSSGWEALFKEQVERTAAWHGVEYRHPFFDRRLVELALALPETQRQQDGRSKVVVRAAMRGRLPDALLAREAKVDFTELYLDAIDRLGGPGLVERLAIAEAGWVDADRVRELFRRIRLGGAAGRSADLVLPVWAILSVEHWFRAIMLGARRCGTGPVGRVVPAVAPARAGGGSS